VPAFGHPIVHPIVPEPTPTARPFWDGLREGKILVQYSPSLDRYVFYPRVRAPGTLADDLEWREVSGAARLYTFTIARRPTAPPWEGRTPQVIAIVELAEGPRLTSELVNADLTQIKIGMALRPVFSTDDNGETLLLFEPGLLA
jgi:uncharacterized protein